jgi:hypothetical protein
MPGGRIPGFLMMLSLTGMVQAEPAAEGTVVEKVQQDPGRSEVTFSVRPRRDQLYFYPCADCHEFMDSNGDIRQLEVETGHPAGLEHGDGRIWCLSCHSSTSQYNMLHDLLGQDLDLDRGYRVCAGCHGEHYRDWSHGAHGKRVAVWRGERVLFSCVECHNPHHPAIAPRAPQPPPPVRAGLEPMKGQVSGKGVPWLSRTEGAASE